MALVQRIQATDTQHLFSAMLQQTMTNRQKFGLTQVLPVAPSISPAQTWEAELELQKSPLPLELVVAVTHLQP